MVFISGAVFGKDTPVDRAITAISNALPPGWTLADRETNEIPFGHHWGESYSGPKGVLLTIKGIRPVNTDFRDANGHWKSVHTSTEALDVWVMPSNYDDSGWVSFKAPVQPTIIVRHGAVKIYARPSSVLAISKQEFKNLVLESDGVGGNDSPWDSPKLLTWKRWRPKLREAIEKTFSK